MKYTSEVMTARGCGHSSGPRVVVMIGSEVSGVVLMDRRPISFDESCARECCYRITPCCGPTVHGLRGHVCEGCLEGVVSRLAEEIASDVHRCSYCGSSPAWANQLPEAICRVCAITALETARAWYARKNT